MAGLDANTKLLWHANGGQGNKEVKDEGNNQIPLTLQGSAAIQTDDAIRRFGVGCLVLDGSGDYISITDHADWDVFGSAGTNWTIDFWVRHSSVSGRDCYVSQYQDSNNFWQIGHDGPGGLFIELFTGGSYKINLTGGGTVTNDTWHHICFIKHSTNVYGMYLDGKQTSYVSNSNTLSASANLHIGMFSTSSNPMHGYMDELRIINDNPFGATPNVGLTDTITVPDAPHTSDGNTKLLLHFEDITDSGNTNHTADITYNGNAQHTGVRRFGRGSADFDGSADYITVADSADWDILPQTNFTIDAWVKFDDHAGSEAIVHQGEDTSNFWMLYHNHGDGWHWQVSGNSVYDLATGVEVTDIAWHHIAVCQVGATVGVYMDGVQIGYIVPGASDTFAAALQIGNRTTGGTYFYDGKIDGLRITHNNAFLASPNVGKTDTITVPTAAHTSDANTKLLMHFDYSCLKDDGNTNHGQFGGNNNIVVFPTTGGPEITATWGRFGNGGLFLDGNSDYANRDITAHFSMGITEFTVEAWVYCNTNTTHDVIIDLGQGGNDGIRLNINTSQQISTYLEGTQTVFSPVSDERPRCGSWYHIAIARDSSTNYRGFINGRLISSTTSTTHIITGTPGATRQITIGRDTNGSFYFDGYIDSVRVSNVARYTAAFTPSTDPFTNDGNTLYLTNMEPLDVSADGGRDPEIEHGEQFFNTAIADRGPERRFGQGALYFNSTGRVQIADHTDWDIAGTNTAGAGNGDFTVDFWFKYAVTPSGTHQFITQYQDANNHWSIWHESGSTHGLSFTLNVGGSALKLGDNTSTPRQIQDTDWHHCALVRVATGATANYALYCDGVCVDIGTSANTATFSSELGIGRYPGFAGNWNGYMDEIRIQNSNVFGADPTTQEENIAVPLTPHTADGNTHLLLHCEDVFDDGDTNHGVNGLGNITYYSATQHTGISRFDDGSMSFSGAATSYLTYPDSTDWNRSSDFTIDFWGKCIAKDGANIVSWIGQGNNTANDRWQLRISSTSIEYDGYSGGTRTVFMVRGSLTTDIWDVGQWHHIAMTRSGNDYRFFVNGIQHGTTYTDSDAVGDSSDPLSIGRCQGGSGFRYYNGLFDSLRFTPSALWTSNFTPPRSTVASSSEDLLMKGDYDGRDSSSNNHTPTYGADASATAVKRFGAGGIYLDGNSDYVRVPDATPDFDICKSSAENWTVDFWVKHDSAPSLQCYFSQRQDASNYYFMINQVGQGIEFWYVSGGVARIDGDTFSNTDITDLVWHHIALCKVGSTWGMYLDGQQIGYVASVTVGAAFAGPLEVGRDSTNGWYHNGRIDEFRIQYGNYFSAAPVVGLTDTITVPTEEYSSGAPAPTVPVTGNQAVMFG